MTEVRPLRSYAEVALGRQRSPAHESGPFMVPYLRAANVKDGGLDLHDVLEMNFTPDEQSTFALRRGDVLVTEGSGSLRSVGASAVWNADLPGLHCFQNTLIRLRPQPRTDPRFLAWWCRHAFASGLFASIADGANIYHLSAERVRALPMTYLPLDEQRAIADYLDRETARIDALIAAKERMIARLYEKRSALLTDAAIGARVRGPRRAAGATLGSLPAHWDLVRFSRCVKVAEGQVDPTVDPYADMVLIAPNHVESGTGVLAETETAREQQAISGKYLCRSGDVVYSKIRPALRKVVISPGVALCSADMYPLRPHRSLRADFLLAFLLSEPFTNWAIAESERVAMPKLNRETLAELRVPVPPTAEQAAVVQSLSVATSRLDAARKAVGESVLLLKELRQALIASVVTGEIETGAAA